MSTSRVPITVLTGFLGSGKTTILLNLIPQLPKSYKLALLKNEFGDVAIDSQLASASAISGVEELLNGCICCNVTGQLGDALETLRTTYSPDRVIIETSGSASPATLALEINRLAQETGNYVLDGVVNVIDVENWRGYEDTSVTARMQAKFTDLIIFNKWENVDERSFDLCLDRIGDLDVQTPWEKSEKGRVDRDLLLGIDRGLARDYALANSDQHEHAHDHQSEVEVLSVTLSDPAINGSGRVPAVDMDKLQNFLKRAPKDEIYRIKAIMRASATPTSSSGEPAEGAATAAGEDEDGCVGGRYILNWAFGRWTFTSVGAATETENAADAPGESLR